MTIDEFFTKYNGKPLDFDGYYGYQCMDLYRQYVKECLEFPQSPGVAGAADVWDTYLSDRYDRIENTPTGVPEKGCIIIWNANAGGGYGHIAIFNNGDANAFVSFDQNWPVSSYCHFQSHNYTNVRGWLKPKTVTITPEVITSAQAKIDLSSLDNATALHEPYGVQELQAIKSKFIEKDQRIADYIAHPQIVTASDPRIQQIRDVFNGSGWWWTKYAKVKEIVFKA